MDLSSLLSVVSEASGLDGVRQRLASSRPGEPPILGIGDSAKAAVIAALARDAARPTLVAVPKQPHAQQLIEELLAWLGDALPVLLFPERDALLYEHVAPDLEATRDRLVAINALRSAEPVVIVASAVAIGQRTLGVDAPAPVALKAGDHRTPDELLAALLALGYRSAPLVDVPGTMARRGGIVDAFPIADDAPVRIEFLGDRIESLRRFSAETQRSLERIESTEVGPASEVADMAKAATALAGQLDLSATSLDMRERFEEELDRLRHGERILAEGFYVPFLASGSLFDHLASDALIVVDEAADVTKTLEEHDAHLAELRQDLDQRRELPGGLPAPNVPPAELLDALGQRRRIVLSRWALEAAPDAPAAFATATTRLPFAATDAYGGRLRNLASDAAQATRRGRALVIVSQQAQRLAEVLSEEGVHVALTDAPATPEPGTVALVHGSLPQGWRLAAAQPPLTLLTDAEVFGFVKQRRRLPRRGSGATREAFLADLQPGDYVVHIEHGIARFAGMVRRQANGAEHEYLKLRYDQGDKLYVPAEQVDRVSRYVGPGGETPSLTRLGSQEWSRTKARVRRAVADLAKELLELYASRQLVEGRAFSPDGAWVQELEASFPYFETPDQLAAVRAVKEDMERARPMDRLVCGDVGYGKTEVAVRAAFKAVLDGTQVAVLVPTTVLAQQHFQTFRERLSGFPVRVEMLSRFRSDREQREVVEALAAGTVDIVIGTHRLLQKDIGFKNLGLVIIDEEQRFGVAHKERLKQMRREVDVLTLSATPIPRTLHMSLSGIRDMSTMETPPEQRLPIKTYVLELDDHIVREAILRELERGGQVYFLHNRVHDIELVAAKLRDLVPEAEISIGHGQQHEDALEQVMLDFVAGRVDVLVCTTIIESGLNIPNVNTIIIDKADKLGLAQLYQLRGRVGRGAARAYAYLLFEKYRSLSEPAQKRLQAIFEATELGAGFQIALHDLEIRGAGNLLGAEQSGHISAVGFDLYMRLLSDAVDRLKAIREGQASPAPRTEQPPLLIDLPFTAHLPETYIGDINLRLSIYQRMSEVQTVEETDALAQELRDRFGTPPSAAENLLFAVRVRALARKGGVSSVQREDSQLVIHSTGDTPVRDRLSGLQVNGVSLGKTQVRLDLPALGEGWSEALLDVMGDLAASTAT
jgi:transcription-repair coupling factor (superfamily II helicase)